MMDEGMSLEDALDAVDQWLEQDPPGGWIEEALNVVYDAAWRYHLASR